MYSIYSILIYNISSKERIIFYEEKVEYLKRLLKY
ncbi:hypothetical protein BN172_4710024 [Clostridioides difficile T15]|nr:hypothetical protein BN172_4710024 [Clostridioides difficile T15]